jgi:hypothetical protein
MVPVAPIITGITLVFTLLLSSSSALLPGTKNVYNYSAFEKSLCT